MSAAAYFRTSENRILSGWRLEIMFGRTRHRRSLLHGAKVHYRAGDEATVDARPVCMNSLRLLRDEFYLLPPEGMPIYIVRSWPAAGARLCRRSAD